MDHNNFYAYETGTRSSSIQGWVETLGSPNGLNHTPTSLEDAPATLFRFDQDIDEALMFPPTGLSDFLYDPDPVGNWQYIDNTVMPYPVPVLTDDMATTAYSTSQAPSPASGTTLVDSPFAFSANVELTRAGDMLVDQPVASPPSAFHNYAFTYQCGPTVTPPPFDPSPDLLQQTFCGSNFVYDQGQYWSGQQPSQHWVGAADVVAPGLATGVGVNANTFAFTSMNPMLFSLRSAPFPEHQQEHIIPEQPRPITTTGENRAALDVKVEPNSSAGESNNEDATPPKKKRKQSTAKVFPCTFPGCTSVHSRTHNLKVHMDSVHLGKRDHVCGKPGCSRAFSRKHDLDRHDQSAHTTLGSPRNKNNARAGKGAKDCKVIKRDKYEA